MSGPGSIDISNRNFTVQDFREMVNYENTTNRGYVRSAIGKNGKVVLEKVSKHWYSAPFHGLRSRVDVTSNQQMRERFVEALRNDLTYAGEGNNRFKAIQDRVIYQTGTQTKRTDSLSRTEVAEILKAYDEEFNTGRGRRGILENLIKELKGRSSFTDMDAFKREVLGIQPGDETYAAYVNETDEVDAKGEKLMECGHVKMKRTEVDFRGYLQLLTDRANERRQLDDAHAEISANVRDLLRMQGDEIIVGDKTKQTLHGLLEKTCREQIEQLSVPPPRGAGADMAKSFVKAFVDEVLPVAIRCARDEIRALGIDPEKNPEEFNAYVDDYVSAQGIVGKAKNFLDQAVVGFNDREAWTEQLQNNFGSGREINDSLKVAFRAGNTQAFTQNVAWSNVTGVNRKEYALKLLGMMDKAFDLTKTETVRDLFVKSFLVANYGDDPNEKVNEVGRFTERLRETRCDVETALKVNFGERYVVNGRKTDSRSMGEILTDLGSDGIKVMQQHGISGWTINQLLTRLLPKIINRNISRNREANLSMYRGNQDAGAILKRLVATGEVIDGFWSGKLESEFSATYRRAEKFIRSMASRQGWPAEDLLKEVRGSFQQEFLTMAEDAVAEFLDDADYGPDQQELAAKALTEKFGACRNELMGRVNLRLRAYAMSRTVGSGKAELADGYGLALETLRKLNGEVKNEGRLGDGELVQLARGPLSRRWNEIILRTLSKIPKKERFDDRRLAEVKDEFAKVVQETLNKATAYRQLVVRRLEKTCGEFVDYAFGNENFGLGGYLQLKSPGSDLIDRGRVDAVRQKAVEHLVMLNSGTVSEIVGKFIRDPEAKAGEADVDRRLQNYLDTGAAVDLAYNLLVYHDQHAKAVEEQLKKICFVNVVDTEMVGRVMGAVDEKSPFKAKLARYSEERQLVLAMAFGEGNHGIVEDAQKNPLAYSATSEQFQKEVADRAAKLLEQAAAEYDRRREEMLTAFAPIADGYSGLTDIQKQEVQKFVLENLAATNRERLLNKLSGKGGETEPISLEEAKAYFDRQLFNRLNQIADQKFREFRQVSEKITAVYDAVMPALRRDFSFEDLRMRFSAAVPDEVVSRFSEKMLRDYAEHVNYRLTLEISKDPAIDVLEYAQKTADETDELIKKIVADVSAWAVDQTKDPLAKVAVVDLVDQSGKYAAQTEKTEVYDLLCDNLKTWGAAPGTAERTTEIMKLIVDESWAKYVDGGKGFVESRQLATMKEEVLKELDKAAAGVIKSLFTEKFDRQHVAAALALVDRYVKEGWQFTEHSQVPEMIRKVVIQRIHDLETQGSIDDDTVILDIDFTGNGGGTMDRINAIVNGQGAMDKVVNERGNKLLEMHTAFIRSENPEIFDLQRGGLTALEKEAVAVNTEVLGRFIHNVICNEADRYIAENDKIRDAMIDLPLFDRQVEDAIKSRQDTVLAACMARMQSAKEIPGAVAGKTAECIAELGVMLNAKRPEGRKIVINPDWTIANIEVLGEDTVAQRRLLLFVGYVREEFDKRMQLLSAEAFGNREFGGRLGERFQNAVKDFLIHVGDSSAPATLAELGVESKKGFFSSRSWFNVFLDSMKAK